MDKYGYQHEKVNERECECEYEYGYLCSIRAKGAQVRT